jgi:hypothetical protein
VFIADSSPKGWFVMSIPAFLQRLDLVPEPLPPPRFVGIYFLLSGDEIVYIGQSTRIPQRVATHRYRLKFDRAVWIPVAEEDLDAYEGALIRRLTPPENTGSPSCADRDQEICDLLGLPPCDLARLAVFRASRQRAYADAAVERSRWRRLRNKDKSLFEKRFGIPWIDDPWARTRRANARHLWRAVQPFLEAA